MAKASIVHWTYQEKEGRSPVKIAVNQGNERRYYAMRPKGHVENLYLSPKEFNDAMRFRSDLGKQLKAELNRAENAIPTPFSWVRFEGTYLNTGKSFYTYFEEHLSTLKDRPGTYLSYQSALNKWKVVCQDFMPIELPGQLHRLENACKTKSTSGMYLRASRVIYNLIRKDFPDYPVWNYRINSKVGTHKARTLSNDQLQAFLKIKTLTGPQMEARRIFMISFWGGGMNMADILQLKWTDIKKDRLIFTRQKTKHSGTAPIEIPLSEHLKNYLGEPGKSLFVIANFDRTGSPVEVRQRAKWFTKNINNCLRRICDTNNIEPFTTYSARHTLASSLKFNGVNIEQIKELLGHSDARTTEAYLRRFDIEKKAEALKTIKLT
jgi:integrase/recombinase XerD